MMGTKWIVVAAVTAAMLTNGCMAFQELSGHSRSSRSVSSSRDYSGGDDGALPESDDARTDEATRRAADATDRAAAAADRAAAVAARASTKAEKTESGFHKSLHK